MGESSVVLECWERVVFDGCEGSESGVSDLSDADD